MFEKEAKERTKEYIKDHAEKYNWENENGNTKLEAANYNVGLKTGYEDGFQDGAELGYNKAKEEIEAELIKRIINAVQN